MTPTDRALDDVAAARSTVRAYDFWRRALAIGGGARLTREQFAAGLSIHEDEPQAGFWIVRRGRRPAYTYRPVAIWPDPATGELIAVMDGAEVDPFDVWTEAVWHPVSHEDYEAATRGEWEAA